MEEKREAPALKEIFSAGRIRHIADEATAISSAFDRNAFLAHATDGLDHLSLMQRLRQVSEALHIGLPMDFLPAVAMLRDLAPRLDRGFLTLALPDFVAHYGADHFDASMEALKFFTTFGSSEFAVRHFLRRDIDRALAVMAVWAMDADEHVRRLACEGSRPRLPWSFRIEPLVLDPSPTAVILEALKADPSLYVRKSVANHLNDITKDNPAWVLDRVEDWSRDNAHTAWIVRHALRSLIKKGDKRALTVIGAGEPPAVDLEGLSIAPGVIDLGEAICLSFRLRSTATMRQKLVVDYRIHYRKKSGQASPKVFKLKTLTLEPGEAVLISHRQVIRDFSTRVHYPGRHAVDILVNGEKLGDTFFDLAAPGA
ncbi:MAG: alkylation repair protein [Bradyrhizobium sp.]|nr:alkylation repair protein [Bradyrhizobium sp.]